jgi:hypothetical protein
MTPGPRSFARLGRIALLALCVRLVFFLLVRPWSPAVESGFVLQGDARGYHELATTLLTQHRLAYGATDAPNALRTPGYPVFVAALYALFGWHPWVVMLFQILLDKRIQIAEFPVHKSIPDR